MALRCIATLAKHHVAACRATSLYTVPRRWSTTTVAVALSGGVDSSVAALLMKQQGYNVIGVYMRTWDKEDEVGDDKDTEKACTADIDLESAQATADHLGIPLKEIDFVAEYWYLFEDWLAAYAKITTPCADHACNSVIKFGALRQACLERYGAQYLATGHYAQVVPNAAPGTPPTLRRGLDGNKDQSYFLCTVPADNFHNILMPLGTLTKPQVRKMAKDAGLPSAERKDSYGVCFIGKRKLATFLPKYIDVTPGYFRPIEQPDTCIEPHKGVELYTIGQKAGIGSQNCKQYVARREGDSVFVCSGDHRALYSFSVEVAAQAFNWLDEAARRVVMEQGRPLQCACRVRHTQDEPQACELVLQRDETGEGSTLHVQFAAPARALTAGQVVCVYDSSGAVLGGGIIVDVGPSLYELDQAQQQLQQPGGGGQQQQQQQQQQR